MILKRSISFDMYFNRDSMVGLPAGYSGAEEGAKWHLKKKSASLPPSCKAEVDINLYSMRRATDGAGTELIAYGDSVNIADRPVQGYPVLELGKLVAGVYTRTPVDISALIPVENNVDYGFSSFPAYPSSCFWDSVISKFVLIYRKHTLELVIVPPSEYEGGYQYWNATSIVPLAIAVSTTGVVTDITADFPDASDTSWWNAFFGAVPVTPHSVKFSGKGGGRYYIWDSFEGTKCWNVTTQTMVIAATAHVATFNYSIFHHVMADGDVLRVNDNDNTFKIINPATGAITLSAATVGTDPCGVIHLSGPNSIVINYRNGQIRHFSMAGALLTTIANPLGFSPHPAEGAGPAITLLNATDYIVFRNSGSYPSSQLRLRKFSNTTLAASINLAANQDGHAEPENELMYNAGGGYLVSVNLFGGYRVRPTLVNPTTLALSAVTYTPFGVRTLPQTGYFAALCPAMFLPPEVTGNQVINLSVLISKMQGQEFAGGLPKGSFNFEMGGSGARHFKAYVQVAIPSLDTSCVLAGPGTMFSLAEDNS